MTKVIGVRFRTAGKVYFFDPLQFEIKRGDHVIVETARGIEFGTVVSGVHEVEDEKVIQPLKPVIRIATERDVEQEAANKVKEREAYKVCLEKIRKHELEMKLIDAEYTFDNNKVLFYFTADGRIDFRELVKDLASVFKTRIELRQIGVRDETKIMGGIGICGRPLCCHSYLSDFVPVSIKMAKEQNLSLNPTKISGVCGRLMCCLKNEEETYEELNRKLPGIGDYVTTDDGLKGEVQSVNVLRQIVKVVVENGDEKEIRDYEVSRLQFRKKHGKKEKLELSKEEMKELERLEKEELTEDADSKPENKPERKHERRNNENRGENRENRRNNNRGENRGEGREEGQNRKGDNRGEGREEGQNRKGDNRGEGREEGQNRRNENRSEGREEGQSRRNENRSESREEGQSRKGDNRGEVREEGQNRRNDNRGERRRNENRGEGRQNRRNERQNDNQAVNRNEERAETESVTRNEADSANRGENRGDGQQNRKYNNRRRRNHNRKDGRKQENNEN